MLLDERPATVPEAPPTAAPPAGGAPSWRPALGLAGASLLLAALTFVFPSAPTYDPWAWIVWGREITQFDLSTVDGPSWKPLPVLLTTPFALAGDLAPDLWVWVARAGGIAAIPLAFVLVRRLGGGTVGGLAAAAALGLAPWMVRNAHLANSEPLLIALLLGAAIRLADRDHAGAFGLGVAVGLLRPEAWPFLGVYGLWLLVRRGLPARWVVGAGVVTVALWTLPELWGSGDALRAVSRAQEPNANAATFTDNPALTVVENAFAMLPWSVEAGLLAAAAVLVGLRDRRTAVVLLVAVLWLGIVATMTSSGGFSGNTRYLMPPVALLIVVAGVGVGRAVALLRRPVAVAVAGAVAVAAFGLVHADLLRTSVDRADYQARLTDDLGPLVERAGGADALLACGRPYTGAFLVPQVAWELGVHTSVVALEPERPAVVFRVRTLEGVRPDPSLRALGAGPQRTAAVAGDRWRVVTACGGGR